MEPGGLQELIKKVFGDERTKTEFISDPNSVMSRFSLTEEEKKAVLVTYSKIGLVTAGSQQLDTVVGPMVIWH
jgi:hypothetical protein